MDKVYEFHQYKNKTNLARRKTQEILAILSIVWIVFMTANNKDGVVPQVDCSFNIFLCRSIFLL